MIWAGWTMRPAPRRDVLSFTAVPEGESMESIMDGVRLIVSKELKIPVERITPDTTLQNIGVESLDLIGIIFALEEKFNISIPYNSNEAANARTGEPAKANMGKLETISQISIAVQGFMEAKAIALTGS